MAQEIILSDEKIVDLYWMRDEDAISETDRKYGRILFSCADNILRSREDSKEILNDTYLKGWQTMPEARPVYLCAYLSHFTRQLAIDRFRRMHADKRVISEYTAALDELAECIPGGSEPQKEFDLQLLKQHINTFLSVIDEKQRILFIRRYYCFDSIRNCAKVTGLKENAVRTSLFRLRAKLKDYLEGKGYDI